MYYQFGKQDTRNKMENLSKEYFEKIHSEALADQNLMYINLCLLRMMKYNMESMKSAHKNEAKKIIGDAVRYYDDVMLRRLKMILRKDDFEATNEVLENPKLIELMDMMPILLDLTPKAMQEYNEVLKLAVGLEKDKI